MKETVKKISLGLIASLYLLAAGVTGCYMPDFTANTVKSSKEVYLIKSEYKSSLHTVSESKFTETASNSKISTPVFGILQDYCIDCFIPSNFAQYILKSENFSIRFNSTDIIYPFHYFW